MKRQSPSSDPYEDDFNSPAASDSGGVRPPSLPLTPYSDDFEPSEHESDSLQQTPQQNPQPSAHDHSYLNIITPASHSPRLSSGESLYRHSFSRQQTFVTRNGSRVSQMTYTADAGYDDDFDDEDFGSEKSNTPDRQPSPSSNTEARHNFLESNSYDELNERSQKLVDVPNMSPQGSAKTVTREGKETKSTGNEGISSRHQGRNSQAPSSIGKTSRKLPYSHRRSVRSTRNGFSRMSTTTRQLDIGDLRHEMRVIGEEIEALKLENKSLKRNNVLLTHQLDKREKEEQEVPNVYDRHVKEVRALKDQLRRQQERYDKVHYRLRRTEKNLATSQKEEAELERVAAECELKERSRLRKHLEKIEQENQLCDEKIRQLEKYVEHLDRCHEAELSAEEEKRKETQAIIERLLEETQMAKQSIQAKETELERFKLQRTNRLTMSRALNTGMSGQLSAICESRSDTYVGHLKALPAPPTKETLEMTPANEHHELTPARGSQQVTPAKASKEVKNAKDRFRVNNKQNRVKVTPSPPATSHPNPNSQRSNRAKDSMVKHLTMTAGGKVSGSVTPSIGYDKNSKVGEEEKKAELIRTNMALSLSMKAPADKSIDKVALDEHTAGVPPIGQQYTRDNSFYNKREQTFAVAKSTGPASPRDSTFDTLSQTPSFNHRSPVDQNAGSPPSLLYGAGVKSLSRKRETTIISRDANVNIFGDSLDL